MAYLPQSSVQGEGMTTPLIVIVPMLPPTVNHMYRPDGRGGKLLTDEAKTFRELVCYEARSTANAAGWTVPMSALMFTLILIFGDNRKTDIDNRVKAGLDAVALALQFDDSRVKRIVIEHAGVEKCRPRCEMILEALP